MAVLQATLRKAAGTALRPSAACSTSFTSVRLETSDAIVQRAKENEGNIITNPNGAAFPGDLRSTSGLGIGDGIEDHTGKWLQSDATQGNTKSPMQYIHESEPMKVHGLTVASYGSDDPALGAPVEYIDLRGTTREKPATCKYTGNKYYSEDWRYPGKLAH